MPSVIVTVSFSGEECGEPGGGGGEAEIRGSSNNNKFVMHGRVGLLPQFHAILVHL